MGSGRKQSQKSEVEEALLEAACLYANLMDDLDSILERINANEALDHENDRARTEVMGHLLKALESYSAKAYEDVDRHIHKCPLLINVHYLMDIAAVQRLHAQELLDLKDDAPRNDAKIKIAVVRQRALGNKESTVRLIERLKHQPYLVPVHHGVSA
jgi:hypothetical protein